MPTYILCYIGVKLGLSRRLRLSKNKVPRKMFDSWKEELTAQERLHNQELHNLCSSSDDVMVIKPRQTDWTCSAHGEVEKCVPNFSWKTRDLGVCRRIRCIQMLLKEIGSEGVIWIQLAEDRFHWRLL
jgi:hypothetical protein